MLDRELLKRDPSAGRKLETQPCATTRLVPVHVPTPAALPGTLEGGKVGPRKLVSGESPLNGASDIGGPATMQPEQLFALELARTEFFHIREQQFYIRMLGFGIVGIVAPIFVSVAFERSDPSRSAPFILSGLSFVSFIYAVLTHHYISLSDRLIHVVSDLQKKKIDLPGPEDTITPDWTIIHGAILVLPCLFAMLVAYPYFYRLTRRLHTMALFSLWGVIGLVNSGILVRAADNWVRNRRELSKQLSGRAGSVEQWVIDYATYLGWLVGVFVAIGLLWPLLWRFLRTVIAAILRLLQRVGMPH